MDTLRAVLDDRVRTVLERLEREDAEERAQGLAASERARCRSTGGSSSASSCSSRRFRYGLVYRGKEVVR